MYDPQTGLKFGETNGFKEMTLIKKIGSFKFNSSFFWKKENFDCFGVYSITNTIIES